MVKSRFKDILATYIYSYVFLVISLPVLFAVEYALFGNSWLNFNPPPYLLKPTISYILFGIEGIILLYGTVLSIIGVYVQTRLKVYSIIVGTIFSILLSLLPVLLIQL